MEKDYSWGEFYETMVEMEKKGDTAKNEIFEKCSKLFSALDGATTLKKVQNIIKRFPLTEYEQNYINSSCLDGILLSAKAEKPLIALVKKGEYIETCKYYLSKGMAKRCLYKAIKYGRLKTVELLVKKYGADINVNRRPYGWPLSWATYTNQPEIAIFIIENENESKMDDGYDEFGGYEGYVCEVTTNLDLVKYLFNKSEEYWSSLLQGALHKHRSDVIHFLLENGVMEKENRDKEGLGQLREDIAYNCYNLEDWECFYKHGLVIDTEYMEYVVDVGECFPGMYFCLTKVDTISEENAKKILKILFSKNYDRELKKYGSEIVTLLVQKGISFDIIKKAIGPVFDCVKTVLELQSEKID